jgi:5-methylcytosine-specific restriction protein A
MKIKDLPRPVTVAKADWLPATTWMGFTPTGKRPDAAAQCQSTIQKQIAGGFVLERVTKKFDDPNPGFEGHERLKEERALHQKFADSLIAIHQLKVISLPLQRLVGKDEFNLLQDMWSEPGKRNRWSVAFPIVRTFEIVGAPKADDVFSPDVVSGLFNYATAYLRPLKDEARRQIADLEIIEKRAANEWVVVAEEFAKAERSDVSKRSMRDIGKDLAGALEGQSEEKKAKYKRRAAWLADRFIRSRKQEGKLSCDDCGFRAEDLGDIPASRYRSCFDVHHKDPLAEGVRITTLEDFALLCPTCHRVEHIRLRLNSAPRGE